jgi:hypothetical protein
MNQDEFELQLLALWTRTRIPLTRANIQLHTRETRARAEKHLEALTKAAVVELDSDDEGNIVYRVRGATRPRSGPESFGELERRDALAGELSAVKAAAGLALSSAGLSEGKLAATGKSFATRALATPKGGKSVLLSTGLSFFFGPLGWLYAGSFREAIPVAIVYAAIVYIVPTFFLIWILGIVSVVSALAGLLYAWSYNRTGQRAPLVLADKPRKLLGG